MREVIVQRLQKQLSKQGIDAAVCVSPENFAWVSGFVVPSHPLMRWRHAIIVVPVEGEPQYLVVNMEESTVAANDPAAQVHSWHEFNGDAMQSLASLLRQMGLADAQIGTELGYLPAGDFQRLQSALPGAALVDIDTQLAKLRQIKTAEEIDLMARLARIADEAILDALRSVTVASSEMDIAGALTRNIYALGAEYFKLMIVATGERSVYPNVGPTQRKLQSGDVCRVEIFSMINGYHAGVCRTACVVEAPPHADEIWKNLVECKYLVLDMIKPGASTREIYEAFLGHLGKLGLPPISFIGHGIGLHLHEQPYLGRYSDEPLEAGMVLGIEPLVYDTGYGFGMQNKDIVLVTETGSRLLSDVSDTDKLITVL